MWELLLLPAAAASGWWLSKRNRSNPNSTCAAKLPANYFKGLNYLLNEQPDKAIEVFVRMIEVDSETVDTHFALGSLFRRRGEVDRAIRIHQNLIARTTLSKVQRTQALLELGEDYMRAGLLDRAETLFLELVELNEHTTSALRYLIDIYQLEHDWEEAIRMSLALQSATGESRIVVIAHYYCELAMQAQQNKDNELIQRMIKRALECDGNCVRASLMISQLDINAANYAEAIRSLKQIEYQDPDYLVEAIIPLLHCHRALGLMKDMINYLERILSLRGSIDIMLVLTELLREQYGDQHAVCFLTEQLRKRPSLRGLDKFIELNLGHSQGVARQNLLLLKHLMGELLTEKLMYLCAKCGFSGGTLHWQCPSCKSWSSIKPYYGAESE